MTRPTYTLLQNMHHTTVLLVEDNSKLATYIKEYLTKAGYCVTHQSRGDKAIYQIIQDQPEIVILDILLPGLNGVQVCQSVRTQFSGMILMLTALGENEDQIAGLHNGADDYVVKPIDPAVLLARIQALQRRHAPKTIQRIFHFGALHIDTVQHIVKLFNMEISLKPREFELLIFLAQNADHIVNRENIMQALRGVSYDGVDRTIDLRISYLRKKLGDNIEAPYRIKTIRGKGYIFISTAWDTTQ